MKKKLLCLVILFLSVNLFASDVKTIDTLLKDFLSKGSYVYVPHYNKNDTFTSSDYFPKSTITKIHLWRESLTISFGDIKTIISYSNINDQTEFRLEDYDFALDEEYNLIITEIKKNK